MTVKEMHKQLGQCIAEIDYIEDAEIVYVDASGIPVPLKVGKYDFFSLLTGRCIS